MKTFYIVIPELGIGDEIATREAAIEIARDAVRDGYDARFVYEVRLIGKAQKRVEFVEDET